MGKFKGLVPCLCWRNLGTVTEPNKRQSTGARRCDQLPGGNCLEKPPPQEPVQKLEESVACEIGRSTTDFVPQERQPATKLDAKKAPNDATSAVLAKAEYGNNDLPLPSAASANEKENISEPQLLVTKDNDFIHSNLSVLEEKLKSDDDGRNTSQDTIPGNESRVTSSPISLMCPTSTGGGEEDHRTVVSVPSFRGDQGRQDDENEVLNGTNIAQDLQDEVQFSFTSQTMEIGVETNRKGDHRAIVSTVAIPETQESHKVETDVMNATNIVQEQKGGKDCFCTAKHIVEKGGESTEVLQADGIGQSVDNGKELETISSKKKRKSCRKRGNRSQGDANTGQNAGIETELLAAGDNIAADCDFLEHGLRKTEPAGEPVVPQNSHKQTEGAKPLRKHKKKKSKAKGKRRHGKTGRR